MTFLNVKEVADILKCREQTVKNMIQSGELKGYKIGKMYKVSEEDFREFLESCKVIADNVEKIDLE